MRRRNEQPLAKAHAGSLNSVPILESRRIPCAANGRLNCLLLRLWRIGVHSGDVACSTVAADIEADLDEVLLQVVAVCFGATHRRQGCVISELSRRSENGGGPSELKLFPRTPISRHPA